MRPNLYVIMEEDRDGQRCVLDMIRMEDISKASVIRSARKLKPYGSRVVVLQDDNPEELAKTIYKGRF